MGLRLGAIDRIGSPPHQLVDRVVADTVHPSDAPERWFYELEAWLPQGILVGRLPEGIGGYGPFIDEGYRSFTALLDRGTGAATPITVGSLCPLSQYSHDGTWTCFRSAAQQPGRVAVELHRPGAAVQSWPLSGAPFAGAGVWDSRGGRLAFATVPDDFSGSGDWEADTTLYVLSLASGQATVLGGPALQPVAWQRDGALLAFRRGSQTADGERALALVTVDPATGTVRTLAALEGSIIGVVGTP